MAKVKNTGKDYLSGELRVPAGEVADVTEAQAAYLLSADCPGSFVAVEQEKKKDGK